MTVSTTNTESGPYAANGVTTAFPFTFQVMSPDEVSVISRDADGNDTIVDRSAYSVTLSGAVPSIGTVTFAIAPASGVSIIPFSDPSYTQDIAFEDGSRWLASPVNQANDRPVILAQAARAKADRGLSVPIGETGYQLPPAAQRASKFIAHDASGNPIMSAGTGADAGLRTDLAAPTGASLSGAADGNTVQDNLDTRTYQLGAFSTFADDAPVIPSAITRIRTSEHAAGSAVGQADHIHDEAVDSAYVTANPRTSFLAKDGRGFRISEPVVTPAMVGALADGSDDADALDAFIGLIGDGVHGRIASSHTVSRQIVITLKSNFRIDGRGGSIKMADGTTVADGYSALVFNGCTDFELSGIVGDANRANRTPAEVPAHTVQFISCQRVHVADVHLTNAVCDSFYLATKTPSDTSTHCSDIVFERCSSDNAYRQGMSIIQGHHIVIRDSTWSNTNGTAPQAGVDFESNPGDPDGAISHITVENCRFVSNSGYGLQVSNTSNPDDIKVIRSRFESNVLGDMTWGAKSGLIFRTEHYGSTDTRTRGTIDVGATTGSLNGNVAISFPKIRTFTGTSSSKPFLYVHGSSGGNVSLWHVDADSVSILATMAAKRCRVMHGEVGAATAGGAVTFSGDDCRCEGLHVQGYKDTAILSVGNRSKIRGNVLSEPTSNTFAGIRINAGTHHAVEQNEIQRATDAAGKAIQIDSGASVTSLASNVMDGFGSTPLTNSGTIVSNRNNTANDVLLSETALAS